LSCLISQLVLVRNAPHSASCWSLLGPTDG